MPDGHPPFAAVFDQVQKLDLIGGPSVVFIFSIRNMTAQPLSFHPVDLVYVTAEKEKIRQSGFFTEFVTEKGETLDPGHVAKTAPFMWELKLPAIRVGDQVTLTVADKEVSLVQSVTFLCTNSEPARFEQTCCFVETPETQLTNPNASFTSMMQRIIERYELLEDKVGVSLRGVAVEGRVDGYVCTITIRGEAIYSRSDHLEEIHFKVQAVAYKANGGVMRTQYQDFTQSPGDPFDIFELHMGGLWEKPARITVYPILT
jgi:hypothetical protein